MLRFAPSPTGDMHIGDLRVALLNYIVSKQRNEDLIVRIEDIDKKKNIEGKDDEIIGLLPLFGIEYTQVIYQSENIRYHSAMALQLVHDKKAFSCFCSDEWIQKKREEAKENGKEYSYDDACKNLPHELVIDNMNPFTIRLSRPNKAVVINDLIKGEMSFEPDSVDSFTIMNQDKTPTNNFASAIDDMLSDISIVIRSEDHMGNTPKQDHIRSSLGYEKQVEYAHLPTILDDGASSVKYLLEEGFLPEAISNYLISTVIKAPKEIFTMKEAIEWFDLSKISNGPTRFSVEMLRDINHKHLLNLDAKELSRYVGFADEEIGELARVYLEEVSTTKELKTKIAPIFAQKDIPNELKEQAKKIIKIIKNAPFFELYDDFEDYIMKESGLKDEGLSKPLRYILTGSENGPDMAQIYKYLKNYIAEIVR